MTTVERLTFREVEVMTLYSNPYLSKETIARELAITVATLNNHIVSCYQKLNAVDRFALSFRFWTEYPEHRTLIDNYLNDKNQYER